MKKLLALFLIIYNFSVAQNWAPIVSSNEYNYFSTPSFSSAVTIKTDSLIVQGLDEIFHLNKVIKPIGNYKALINQGQFLQKKVISRSNGYVTFKGDSSFTIKINASLGHTWIFDSILNLTATVVQLKQDSILGQLDSMKVISISNSDTIVLSKNNGISYYKKYSSNANFALKGIQNLGLGYLIPKQKDIYNFDIGDVFEYRDVHIDVGQYGYNTYTTILHYQLTILSKNVSGNVLTYTALKKSSDTLSNGTLVQYSKIDTLNYSLTTSSFLNSPNRSLIDSYITCAGGLEKKEMIFDYNSIFNVPTRKSYYTLTSYSADTMNFYGAFTNYKIEEFGVNIGTIYSHCYSWIGLGEHDYKYLIGSIKSGIQYGTITTWTTNAIGVQEYANDETLKVYPTCFSSSLNITSSLKEKYDVTIIDILGRKVYSSSIVTTSAEPIEINLSFIEKGHYFIRLTKIDGKEIIRKIIKTE